MRSNRLYRQSELALPEYLEFAQRYEKAVPDFFLGERLRPWETWAALEGLPWHKYKRVLDVGSFYSSLPLYLKSLGKEVMAIDNYSAYEAGNFCYSTELWEEVMRQFGIEAWEQDARYAFELKLMDADIKLEPWDKLVDGRTLAVLRRLQG